MFGIDGANDNDGMTIPKFITRGPKELKISKFTTQKSKNGKFKVIINFESKPIGGDFEGWEGASGQIGRVDISIFTDGKDGYQQQALDRIAAISKAMGIKDEVKAIKADSIDKYLDAVSKVFKNKYAWFLIGGEEYQITDKETGEDKAKEKITLPRYNYVAATEKELKAKQNGGEFPTDDDLWFFKRLETMDDETPDYNSQNTGNQTNEIPSQSIEQDDLPF